MLAIAAAADADLDDVRALFRAYEADLGVSLCFQGFEQELASLPGCYAEPAGTILLARDGAGSALGVVALRPLADGACEMKRMFVLPRGRGTGLGRALAERIIADGRRLGYRTMRLDTLERLKSAIALYRSLGFVDIAPYGAGGPEAMRWMQLTLV